MAIYVRNSDGSIDTLKIVTLKGDQGEQGIPGLPGQDGINGVDGKDGITPNITIGTVTTLEAGQQATVENVGTLENPILNFGIPKGQDGTGGSGGTSIDDTTISTDTTWSSAKTEDFVLTNTDTVWTDVSGENLSIDYTKEGHLREVEIWGNTVQNEEDLSDIRHLGELYVNDEGEPILDSEGREQYKIEIESCNYKNLLDTNPKSWKIDTNNTSVVLKNVIKVNPNTDYIFIKDGAGVWGFLFQTDKEGRIIKQLVGNNLVSTTFKTPIDCEYITCRIDYASGNVDYPHSRQIRLFKGNKDLGYSKYIENRQSNKTTILLPCQLMKVGDVADRLYWDSEKGKYVVEKRIQKLEDITKNNIPSFSFLEKNRAEGYSTFPIHFNAFNLPHNKSTKIICNKFTYMTNGYTSRISGEWVNIANGQYIVFQVSNDNVATCDYAGFKEWLGDETIEIYIDTEPQLIETNITTPIKLPTYIDKTHIFVSGNVDGSIKAKAPLDGGQAILSLSEENKELKEVNQELKATNDIQDELINTTMLATDEVFSLLEPLLVNAIDNLNFDVSPLVNMYVAMIQRGLKDKEDISEGYKEQVIELLDKLESN